MPGAGTGRSTIVVLVSHSLARASASTEFRVVAAAPRRAADSRAGRTALEIISRRRPRLKLFDAVADCTFVLATTARAHDQAKPVLAPREGAAQLVCASRAERGRDPFGRERIGLVNEEVAMADRDGHSGQSGFC